MPIRQTASATLTTATGATLADAAGGTHMMARAGRMIARIVLRSNATKTTIATKGVSSD